MNDRAATRGGGCNGWLIHRAARSAPALLSERLEEEWLADLAERRTGASRLRFALGCCWATRIIAQEHRLATLVVAAGAGSKSLTVSANDPVGVFSRRTLAIGIVVSLHVAVFYALMTGLSGSLIKVAEPPLQYREIPAVHSRDLPPLPPPNLNPVKLEVPPLDINPAAIPQDTAEVVRAAKQEPQDPPPVTGATDEVMPPHVVSQVQGGPGVGFPHPDDYYPDLARRLEEHGSATVRVCVDPNGRLTSDPITVESTGSARLDEGALKLARAGSGHYRATTEDGRPVNACYPLRIRFQLKN